MRHLAVRSVIPAVLVAVLGACHDSTAPTQQTTPRSALVLSAPITSAGVSPVSAVAAVRSAVPGGPVVFMSLAQGTAPGATAATLANVTTGLTVVAVPRDGGIDPVPVPANIGDSLAVTVSVPAGAPLAFGSDVPASSPPTIVRTIPATNATLVPRNRAIVVVFSEPVAPASVGSASFQLTRNGAPVAGTLSFLDSSRVTVVFTPAALLDADTPYRFAVSRGVTDPNGTPLDTTADVPFTTGQSLLGPVATVAVYPASITIPKDRLVQFTALLTDAAGDTLIGQPVSWASGDNTIATLASTGINMEIMARGAAVGSTTITATSGGVSGATTVSVIGALPTLSFTALSAGLTHTCGLTVGGGVYCWGSNNDGQLGTGGMTSSPYPTAVSGGLSVTSVGAGGFRSCALTGAGAAWCWGDSGVTNVTTLGTGALVPVKVQGAPALSSMVVGGVHACGLTSAGFAYCWGANSWGELGDPSTSGSNVPRAVAGGLQFLSLSAGIAHTCGLAADSTAYCWGYNADGGLGIGTTAPSAVPTPVQGGRHFAALGAGGGHTCAVTAAGALYCWGANGHGQLGAVSAQTCPGQADAVATDACSLTPLAVTGISAVRSVGAGYTHTCALTTAGAAYCWGDNGEAQLGNGTTANSPTPVPVAGGLVFAMLSSAYYHSCGITTGGVAYCWGLGSSGELGDGTTQSRTAPVRVAGQ